MFPLWAKVGKRHVGGGGGETPQKQGVTVHFLVSIHLTLHLLKPLFYLYFLLYGV